jgi:hypothetical protein
MVAFGCKGVIPDLESVKRMVTMSGKALDLPCAIHIRRAGRRRRRTGPETASVTARTGGGVHCDDPIVFSENTTIRAAFSG